MQVNSRASSIALNESTSAWLGIRRPQPSPLSWLSASHPVRIIVYPGYSNILQLTSGIVLCRLACDGFVWYVGGVRVIPQPRSGVGSR
jgi:hypothetical protein